MFWKKKSVIKYDITFYPPSSPSFTVSDAEDVVYLDENRISFWNPDEQAWQVSSLRFTVTEREFNESR